MPCDWNVNYSDKPDLETQTIICRCDECGRFANLPCDRDFETGNLVVQVMTCKEKGGHIETRDRP